MVEAKWEHKKPIIVHSSLSAFGIVKGSAKTVVGALIEVFPRILMPAFTYRTMITPAVGPKNNAINYGNDEYSNRSAKIYHPDMPVDKLIGIIPEEFRLLPDTIRSGHPILSFCGLNVNDIIESQTIDHPFQPLRSLYNQHGYVMLMGVDHIANTSLHLAELNTHRKTFTRWALTKNGIVECPNFPSCSAGFKKAVDILDPITIHSKIGKANIRVVPIQPMVDILTDRLNNDPYFMLCENDKCDRYQAVFNSIT